MTAGARGLPPTGRSVTVVGTICPWTMPIDGARKRSCFFPMAGHVNVAWVCPTAVGTWTWFARAAGQYKMGDAADETAAMVAADRALEAALAEDENG